VESNHKKAGFLKLTPDSFSFFIYKKIGYLKNRWQHYLKKTLVISKSFQKVPGTFWKLFAPDRNFKYYYR